MFVAQFPAAKPESGWTFWDGKTWTRNVTNASPIARGASTSLHVCQIKTKYLLTTSSFSVACDQGKDIFVATSGNAVGPFEPLRKIYTIQDLYKEHAPFFYFPIAHPEFMNANGEILVVSQFTLFASTKKGNRPSYIRSARPEVAVPLYEQFVTNLAAEFGKIVHTGEFGADMQVLLVNDGPVTIIIDTKARE